VNGGALALTGGASLGSTVTVNGGSFGGTGTVAGLNFAPGTTYAVNVSANGASDMINVTGQANIDGAAVHVSSSDPQSAIAPNTTYKILTAQGGVNGTFTGGNSDLAFLASTLSYDQNDVFLTLTRNDVTFGSVGAPSMPMMSYASMDQPSFPVRGVAPRGGMPSDGLVAWAQGFGGWGRSNSDGNAAKLTRSNGGFLAGADRAVDGNLRFGAFAGYSRSLYNVDERLSSGGSDNYHVGIYGGGQCGAANLRGGVTYTWNDIDTVKRVNVGRLLSNNLRADYNSGITQVFGEFGYRVDVAQVALEPFIGLAYVNLHGNGFTEQGGLAALNAAGQDSNVGYSTLGLRGLTMTNWAGTDVTLRGGLGWRHAFGDVDSVMTMAFAGSNGFSVTGLPIAQDAATIEAGLDAALSRSATLGVSYTGQIAQNVQNHAFKGIFAVKF